ncbi:glycosyltransferase family 2 protein [Sphingosinicella terrae]|uniref:glycosyltransferase family 2 protein n=1 Tax=Sphingosinicella terrae TaxID=2172047 RepID=UPI000E0E0301|nr:glycosyltransferase family A protein [Sphingosinicella terrae]
MTPLVTVIIPVYRDWERLELCLGALAKQSLPASDFEVIVANNESQERVAPVALPPNCRIIHEPKPGSYAARNSALRVARGQYLAFTDSDCIPAPRWLEAGLIHLQANPDARITGPVPIFREEGTPRLVFLYEFHTAFKQKQIASLGRCATANLMVPRSVFDRVGPFDERLLSGGDADWGERAKDAGIPLHYVEGFLVAHPARSTFDAIVRKKRRLAGAMAQRKGYSTWRYVARRMLPPFRQFRQYVLQSGRGRLGSVDAFALFFIHWSLQWADAFEFVRVRQGWKSPNRS